MKKEILNLWVKKVLAGQSLTRDEACAIVKFDELPLLEVVNAAYTLRKKFIGNSVKIHILDNVQNGLCGEDCRYCAQSQSSSAKIDVYPMKSEKEILAEAKDAYEAGAFRHCLVFSGKGSSEKRIDHLSHIVRKIKSSFPMQVCVSPGILTKQMAKILKEAGLDRINHNINTSENNYRNICSTHTFAERINTIRAAREVGLEICSGVIIGMGETPDDIVDMAITLGEYKVASMPVNFLLPIDGIALSVPKELTPEYCLRVLCLFRFLNPKAEIRIAAGREYHLRSLEVLALYPANSLFMEGYLNAKGSSRLKTLQMIRDAGFTIESTKKLDDLIAHEKKDALEKELENTDLKIKSSKELRSRSAELLKVQKR